MAYQYKLLVEAFNEASPDKINDECYFDGKAFTKGCEPATLDEMPERISQAVAKKVLEWSEYYDHVTTYLYQVDTAGEKEDQLIAEYFGY